MKHYVRTTLIITFFSFASQGVGFISQMVIAKIFGASHTLDAFLAAITIPQLLITILLGSLSSVFIPVYVDYKTRGLQEEANRLVNSLFNTILLILGIISLVGILFSTQLLRITTPGFNEEQLNIASSIAIIIWPSVVATGLISFFLAFYQAENKFTWQAVVPFLGAMVNLALIILLANTLQGLGLGIAMTASTVVQVLLLISIINGKYKFVLDWKNEGIKQIFRLYMPILFVALITKFTPLLDRFLGSEIGEGSISRLNYGFKILTLISLIISTGISVIIFPKMAMNVASKNFDQLRAITSKGFKIMWLAIAPVISIGFFLSLPLIIIIFQRNMFTYQDSIIVSKITQIYLFALIGMCLGTVSGKIFYVLRDTKTLAVVGTIEATAYILYTVLLTKWLGILGIVAGYVIYLNLSLSWHLLYIKRKLKTKGYNNTVFFFIKVILAAIGAGFFAYLSTVIFTLPLMQLFIGGLSGIIIYATVLRLISYREIKLLFGM